MSDTSPVILWLRRDFRFLDHPAMAAAAATGRPVIPVVIHDDMMAQLGAAPKWRMGLAIAHFGNELAAIGSRLILRKGNALDVLRALITETGAGAVYWSRGYDTDSIARDTNVKAGLTDDGTAAESFIGHLMFEPWKPKTKQGGFYKVYTPFWKHVSSEHHVAAPSAKVTELRAPDRWPASDGLDDWALGAAMRRGAGIVENYVHVGEAAALDRLHRFVDERIDGYKANRDFPMADATSGLSENLTYGEISPRFLWQAGLSAHDQGKQGAGHFMKEVVWREFAYHLMYHFPALATDNWRPEWDGFPWATTGEQVTAWQRGMTGQEFVDAAMRELYVTGIMHNRLRMIVGSYLTKHLLTDWRIGRAWFEDCLIDWDPAANAMGWQWIAGCGPDAAPYFRVFNPETQSAKFDPDGRYRTRFLDVQNSDAAAGFFAAAPLSWGLAFGQRVEQPLISLTDGRNRALAMYKQARD